MYTKPTNVVYFKSESLAGGKKAHHSVKKNQYCPKKYKKLYT